MPWISLFFTSRPERNATSARISEAFNTPCPPSPATTILLVTAEISVTADLLFIATLVLANRFCRKQAVAAGNNHRELRLFQGASHQFLKAFGVGRGIGDDHVA